MADYYRPGDRDNRERDAPYRPKPPAGPYSSSRPPPGWSAYSRPPPPSQAQSQHTYPNASGSAAPPVSPAPPPPQALIKTMDPRHRQKRPPSRSPEGSQPRKASKPSVARDGLESSKSPSLQDGSSRCSSVSVADPRRPRITTSIPPFDERQPSGPANAQMSAGLKNHGRKDVEPSALNSPDSFASGRSTPQPAQMRPRPALMTAVAEPDHVNTLMKAEEQTATQNSILNTLLGFSHEAARMASYQAAFDEATNKFQRACREFKNMESHFGAFPAIREQKTSARSNAEKELNHARNKLDEHKAAQGKYAGVLAAAISHKAEVQPIPQPSVKASAKSTDTVSRAEYEHLQRAFEEMHVELQKALALTAPLDMVEKLKAEQSTIKKLSDEASSEVGQVCGLLNRVRDLESKPQPLDLTTRVLMLERKSSSVDQLHPTADIGSLKARLDAVEKKDTSNELVERFHNLETEFRSADFTKLSTGVDALRDETERFGTKLRAIEDLAGRVQRLEHNFMPTDREPPASGTLTLEERIDAVENELKLIDHQSTEKDKIVDELYAVLEGQITEVKTAVDTVMQEVQVTLGQHRAAIEGLKDGLGAAASSEEQGKLQAAQDGMLEAIRLLRDDWSKAVPSTTVPEAPAPYVQSNGFAPIVNDHLAAPLTHRAPVYPVPSVQDELNKLHNRCDSLVGITQDLKQRYDNLTTDTVVYAMVGQMNEMFPAAKDFQKAANDLERRQNQLDQRLTSHFGAEIAKIKAIEDRLDAIDGPGDAGSPRTSSPSISQRLSAINAAIMTAAGVARDAEAVSKAVELRVRAFDLDPFKKCLEEMQPRLEGMEAEVKQHDEMLQWGNKALEDLKQITNEQQTEIGKVGGQLDAIAKLLG